MSFALLLMFYGLAVSSGVAGATRTAVPSLLARVLIALAWGAAQILLAMEILSLIHQLGETTLFALNLGMTTATWLVARPWRQSALAGWHLPPVAWWKELLKANPLSCGILAFSVTMVLFLGYLHAEASPLGDSYHFSMPPYWAQHASFLPFQASNPRVIGLAFSSEALCFMAVLANKNWHAFYLLGAVAKLFMVWIVIEMALRLGASRSASIAAGALLPAFTPLVNSQSDILLSSMWFSSAIFLLLVAKEDERTWFWGVGFSFFCVVMACGSKNVVAIQTPLYVLFAAWFLGRPFFAWRSIRSAFVGGVLGLICSTTLWIYASNQLYFGNFRGPKLLQEPLSRDFSGSAVWTRMVGGTINSVIDPGWLPQSFHGPFETLVKTSVRVLGGHEHLPEDNDYYAFIGESLQPGTGLGLLGLVYFAPSLALGLSSARKKQAGAPAEAKSAMRWLGVGLAVLSIASFFLCYAMLRPQRAGLTRLFASCLVVGLPLCALMLRATWSRLLATALLLIPFGIATTISIGTIARRLDPAERSWLEAKITRHQKDHTLVLGYRWSDRPEQKLVMREDFSQGELYGLLLSRLPPYSSCGFIANHNSQEHSLFGPNFTNKVYSLRDGRQPEVPRPVPDSVQYIVSENGEPIEQLYAPLGFSLWLEVHDGDKRVFEVLKKNGV